MVAFKIAKKNFFNFSCSSSNHLCFHMNGLSPPNIVIIYLFIYYSNNNGKKFGFKVLTKDFASLPPKGL